MDILVEDCRVEGRGPGTISQHGLHIGSDGGANSTNGPAGRIVFRRVTVNNTLLAGIALIRKPLLSGLQVYFEEVAIEHAALSEGRGWYLDPTTGLNHTSSLWQGLDEGGTAFCTAIYALPFAAIRLQRFFILHCRRERDEAA